MPIHCSVCLSCHYSCPFLTRNGTGAVALIPRRRRARSMSPRRRGAVEIDVYRDVEAGEKT